MKAIIKRTVGELAIEIGSRLPRMRSVLKSIGLRCSQGLFGNRIVSVANNNGFQLRLVEVDKSYLAFQLFWHGLNYYEPITRLLLGQLLAPGATLLDIGAHHGFFALTTGLRANGVRVVAFEPNPGNFRILQSNVVANHLTNVHCEPLAVSDSDGAATLYLTASDMSASLKKGFQSHDTQQIGGLEVRTSALDSYLRERGIAAPIVIKVDIEGHEAAFMRGAMETIRRFKPDIILEVVEDQDPKWVAELKALGYHFYPITDQGLSEIDTPRLIKRFPFLFLNYLLTTRPADELSAMFKSIEREVRAINLHDTSKHFRKEEWPLLWAE